MSAAHELVVDNFAGAGGASLGIERAIGRPIDYAINHSAAALAVHRLNHSQTVHLCEDIFAVDPRDVAKGRPVGLAWFSPDCTHHSRAKGGKPREKKIRGLAWVVIRWAATVKPRVIFLENVPEFEEWCPLTNDNVPDKARKGETFRQWKRQLESHGYRVEYRVLCAADYGAPTSRKRLFVIARCDGRPIVWPKPTHGPGRAHPYRTATECIDWSLPCPSIFERKRPLAENTLKRIARGIQRFVIDTPTPFIVQYHSPKRDGDHRVADINAPLPTQTTENRFGLVTPYLVQSGYGEREGQAPRVLDIDKPLGTVVASGAKHALVSAFLAKHYGGVTGHDLNRPIGTVTQVDHHSLCTAFLSKFYGTSTGQDVREAMPTVTGGGLHVAEVRAFLIKYYSTAVGQKASEPMHTLTAKARLGLVTVRGTLYHIVDIGLRMLSPRELARAQGFPDTYILIGSKAAQVSHIGNSVPPVMSEVLVRANYVDAALAEVAV